MNETREPNYCPMRLLDNGHVESDILRLIVTQADPPTRRFRVIDTRYQVIAGVSIHPLSSGHFSAYGPLDDTRFPLQEYERLTARIV